jgi:NADH-quinone oxidoreductase subunit H
MMISLFHYFIFPGFLFLLAAGVLVSWIDRKVTARVQWRQGPPLLQPAYDLIKLFMKEIVVPAQSSVRLFILAPAIAVLSVILVANHVLLVSFLPSAGFSGDIIVILYLFAMLPLCTILGASSSGNPLASIGASREMKLVLSYELPLLISVLVPALRAGSFSLNQIISYQQANGSFAASLSGLIAMAIALLCLHGKMGLVPFDASEAEQEISGGSLVEYSGPLLALWKFSKMVMLIAAPFFIAALYWGGGTPLWLIPKYLLLLTAAILLRNTNPRLRIDQIVKLFWGLVTAGAVLALGLSAIGF